MRSGHDHHTGERGARTSGQSPTMSRADMLKETCPDDLQDFDRPPHPRRPSPMLVIGPAFVVLVGLVLVGALHTALGSPLGDAWAMEVWSMTKSMIFPTIVAASFGVYVTRQHAGHEPPGLPPDMSGVRRRPLPGHVTGRHRVIQIEAEPIEADDEETGR